MSKMSKNDQTLKKPGKKRTKIFKNLKKCQKT